MTERISPKWEPSTTEAFGNSESVVIGRQGELAVLKEVSSWKGWKAWDHESDKENQLKGIDISILKEGWSREYTVDVKTGKSYLDQYGNINVDASEDGWLFDESKSSDRIWHVNLDTGWMAWYDRNEMKKYVSDNVKEGCDNMKIGVKSTPSFVYRRRLQEYNV